MSNLEFAKAVGKDIKKVQSGVIENKYELVNPSNGERFISPISYWYPDFHKTTSKWNQAITMSDKLGFVIINPNSGPGDQKDDMYVQQAIRAKAVGATVLAYVATGYGKIEIDSIISQIKQYQDWYTIEGVFLDETINGFSEQASLIPKYIEMGKRIKDTYGKDFIVVANPGSNVIESLLDSADVFMNFESAAENYINDSREVTPSYCLSQPYNKFWHCIYNVNKSNYKAVLEKADKEHVGHLYLVDNPSYGSPAAPWLQNAMRDWANKNTSLAKRVEQLETSGTTAPSGQASSITMSIYKIPDEYLPKSFKNKVDAKIAIYGNIVNISIKVNSYIGSSSETDSDKATETWPASLMGINGEITVPFTKYSSKQGYAPFIALDDAKLMTFRGSGMDSQGMCHGNTQYLCPNPEIPSGWQKL